MTRHSEEPTAGTATEETAAPRKVEQVVKKATRIRPVRAVMRYLDSDGELMAAGMSFQAIFAVFAAIYVAFAIAGIWLAGQPVLLEALIGIINQGVPNLISDDPNALIHPEQLTKLGVFGWTGTIAAAVLLFTAIGWLGSTRLAIRSIFELPKASGNFILTKLADLLLALAFGVLLLLGATASVVSTQAMQWLLGLLGLGSNSFWGHLGAGLVGVAVSIGIYTLTISGMYRLLARIPIPRRDLYIGSLVVAIVLYGLSVASGALLGGASRNPLLATFAVLIAVMIWFNFVCRVILIGAAWVAVGLEKKGVTLWQPDEHTRAIQLAEAEVLIAEEHFATAAARARSARFLHRPRAQRELRAAREALREARSHRNGLR